MLGERHPAREFGGAGRQPAPGASDRQTVSPFVTRGRAIASMESMTSGGEPTAVTLKEGIRFGLKRRIEGRPAAGKCGAVPNEPDTIQKRVPTAT